ncbi:MAG: hypothetical protein JF626_10940 [Polaromonas sp.]|nr:hypothetical protein [Polaromonas sp.]
MQNSEGAFGNTLTPSGIASAAEKTMKKGQSLFKLQPFNFLGKQLLI